MEHLVFPKYHMPGDPKMLGDWIITPVPLFFKAMAKKTT
jgi:hypothetical protein